MKYARVASYFYESLWAILESKYQEIEAILQWHMEGSKFTTEELRARFGEPAQSPESLKRGAVAVIPLRGVIAHRMGGMAEMSGAMSTERFSAMFRQALNDDAVSAIVVDVDSPGGTITGCTELANEIYSARGRKPIVAHVNALCASAAYWIASAADRIEATPSGLVGSIGIVTPEFVDTSEADEKAGIKRTVISAGKYKAEGYVPLTDEAKAAIKARVDEAYAVMTADIARGRGVKPAAVREGFGEGRVISAKEGLKLGMIDRISTFDETITRLTGRGARAGAGMRAEDEAVHLEAAESLDGLSAEMLADATEQQRRADADIEADRRRRLERF